MLKLICGQFPFRTFAIITADVESLIAEGSEAIIDNEGEREYSGIRIETKIVYTISMSISLVYNCSS